MSQLSPAVNPGSNVPVDLKCGFCQTPVEGVYYRTLNKFACINCAAQVKNVIDHNIMTPKYYAQAGGAGLLTGLGCAVAWAVIVHVTKLEIGIVASLIGYAVGRAVFMASGKRRGVALQWLAAVLSVLGIVGGKLMLLGWRIADLLPQNGIPVTTDNVVQNMMDVLKNNPSVVFNGFDIIWIALAVLAAFRICKSPPITIAGPYPHTPPAQTDLQFHTVEPAMPPSIAEQA